MAGRLKAKPLVPFHCPSCKHPMQILDRPRIRVKCGECGFICDVRRDTIEDIPRGRKAAGERPQKLGAPYCYACGGEGWLPSLPEGQSECPYCKGKGK